ncbi:hypothetical protein [Arthrobacter sp. D2-10]
MPAPGEAADAQRHGNDDGASPAAVVVPPSPHLARWHGVLAAVVAGVLAAVFGTALHANVWYLGGMGLPVGALAAIVLAVSLAVFVAVSGRNVLLAGLTGAVAYILVGLAASFSAGSLIAAGVELEGAQPPVSLAGYVWVVGLAVGTVIAVAVSWWVLRPTRRR